MKDSVEKSTARKFTVLLRPKFPSEDFMKFRKFQFENF